jgi:hypothetical protein
VDGFERPAAVEEVLILGYNGLPEFQMIFEFGSNEGGEVYIWPIEGKGGRRKTSRAAKFIRH